MDTILEAHLRAIERAVSDEDSCGCVAVREILDGITNAPTKETVEADTDEKADLCRCEEPEKPRFWHCGGCGGIVGSRAGYAVPPQLTKKMLDGLQVLSSDGHAIYGGVVLRWACTCEAEEHLVGERLVKEPLVDVDCPVHGQDAPVGGNLPSGDPDETVEFVDGGPSVAPLTIRRLKDSEEIAQGLQPDMIEVFLDASIHELSTDEIESLPSILRLGAGHETSLATKLMRAAADEIEQLRASQPSLLHWLMAMIGEAECLGRDLEELESGARRFPTALPNREDITEARAAWKRGKDALFVAQPDAAKGASYVELLGGLNEAYVGGLRDGADGVVPPTTVCEQCDGSGWVDIGEPCPSPRHMRGTP